MITRNQRGWMPRRPLTCHSTAAKVGLQRNSSTLILLPFHEQEILLLRLTMLAMRTLFSLLSGEISVTAPFTFTSQRTEVKRGRVRLSFRGVAPLSSLIGRE